MAQPVTALLDPEPDDNRMPACPDFCDGTCTDWNDEDGDAHHTSGDRIITLAEVEHGEPVEWLVSTSRTDADFQAGPVDVNLSLRYSNGATMTAFEARQLAAMLLNAADQAEPLPVGVMATSPEQLHLGDELLTDDGWQTITGLMFFTDPEQVSVFTHERNDEESDGWQLDPEVLVQIRRHIHGSCAIQFVEPLS